MFWSFRLVCLPDLLTPGRSVLLKRAVSQDPHPWSHLLLCLSPFPIAVTEHPRSVIYKGKSFGVVDGSGGCKFTIRG